MKSGIYTTEFWLSLIVQVVPILVLTGVLSPDDAGQVQGSANDVVTTGFAFVSAAIVAVGYIWGRVKVKTSGK